jgi:hypothetical protein
MWRAKVLICLTVLAFGCGVADTPKAEQNRKELEQSRADLNYAIAVSQSRDPTVRIAAWQRKWIKDGKYNRPKRGVFEAREDNFNLRWSFAERDVVLTVTERSDLDDEDRFYLFTFVLDLDTEWGIGPVFISGDDRSAGGEACDKLQQMIIDEAIKRQTIADTIAEMKGPNRAVAMSRSYKTLVNSGKRISTDEIIGDVFSFSATADFAKDGTVTATLFIIGR